MSGKSICLVRDAFDSLGGERGFEAAERVSVLIAGGFRVHLLFTGLLPAPRAWNVIQARWSAAGLSLHLPGDGFDTKVPLRVRSYAIHRWLEDNPFDIADFDDDGSAFYAALARQQGLAHRETTITVVTSTVLEGQLDAEETYVESPGMLQALFMRERVLELADIVFCDCELTARSVRKRRAGPLHTGPPPTAPSAREGKAHVPIREVAFLGDQTVEHGFLEFVEAAKVLARDANVRFAFIGRFAPVNLQHSGAVAVQALSGHGAALEFLADPGHAELIDYLGRPGLLVVMPRRRTATLALLIKSAVLGTNILVSDIEPHRAVAARPDGEADPMLAPHDGLAAAIARALQHPPRVEPAFDIEKRNAEFLAPLADAPALPAPSVDKGAPAAISICLVHYKRPLLLEQALEGLSRQTCLDFELIVVNDGGDTEDVLSGLRKRLSACPFPWRLIATDNVWLGAARNSAAAAAKGGYLIFVDDDNVPMPHMVETMRAVAHERDIDIGTCLFRVFQGSERPDDVSARPVEYLPTGGPASLGLIENVFGDANAIIRTECFRALAGFDATPRVGAEDWDFFLRAALQRYRLEVIAAPLYFYRVHEHRLNERPHSQYKYYRRLLGRFLGTRDIDDQIEGVVRVALGRNAADLIRSTVADRNRFSPHGFLLDRLDAALTSSDLAEQYSLLGQLMTSVNQDHTGDDLMIQSIDRMLEDRRDPLDESSSDNPSIVFPTCTNPKVVIATEPSYIRFDQDKAATLVHPSDLEKGLPSQTTIELPIPLPTDCTRITVDVAVLHPDSPKIRFTLYTFPRPLTNENLFTKIFPSRHSASKTLSHKDLSYKDGWATIQVDLDMSDRKTRQYARITTSSLGINANAWAYFKNIRLWFPSGERPPPRRLRAS